MVVLNFILTELFISPPEIIFVFLFVSIFTKHFDFRKVLICSLAIPVVPDFLRFYCGLPIPFNAAIFAILCGVTIIKTFKFFGVREFIIVSLLNILAFGVMAGCEIIYFTNQFIHMQTAIEINFPFLKNFLASLPLRVMEFSIYFVIKFIKYIFERRVTNER